MRKKFLAILFSTLMGATCFGCITALADEDIPEEWEAPYLPVNVDDTDGSTPPQGNYDLYMDDYYLQRTHLQDYTWRIDYQIWNYGEDDLRYHTFWDGAWLWLGGAWDKIVDSVIYHYANNFTLGAGNHANFSYEFEAPQGWHPFSQWTDAGANVNETNENNNDCLKALWSW